MLRDGIGPGLLRRRGAAVGDRDGTEGGTPFCLTRSTHETNVSTANGAVHRQKTLLNRNRAGSIEQTTTVSDE